MKLQLTESAVSVNRGLPAIIMLPALRPTGVGFGRGNVGVAEKFGMGDRDSISISRRGMSHMLSSPHA